MTSCRSCGKEIVWAVSPNGKKIPLEEIKTQIYRMGGGAFEPKDRATKLDPDMTGRLYISHFATCPEANDWGKKGKGR